MVRIVETYPATLISSGPRSTIRSPSIFSRLVPPVSWSCFLVTTTAASPVWPEHVLVRLAACAVTRTRTSPAMTGAAEVKVRRPRRICPRARRPCRPGASREREQRVSPAAALMHASAKVELPALAAGCGEIRVEQRRAAQWLSDVKQH